MSRKHVIALVGIVVAFVVLLPLYYVFSYGKNDALQQTIQQGNGTTDGTYNAPLSYGGDYLRSVAYGVIGIVVVFAASYLLFLALRKRKAGQR